MTPTEKLLVLPADPIEAFQAWFDDAVRAACPEPTAMTLATVAPDGFPSARIVLYKGFSDRCFSFVTNYESRKGRELDAHPKAALVFHWQPLKRQVRVEGAVERMPAAEADAYFQSRPRGSQIGAWSSPQSQVIADREDLEALVARTDERFHGQAVPRPPFWGGYRVRPHRIEFWEERPSRLHERFVYELKDGQWVKARLAP